MRDTNLLILIVLLFTMTAQARNEVPQWSTGAVWYQIVPERFRNINPYNDPTKEQVVGKDAKDWQIHPWASDWYKQQIWEEHRNVDFDKLLLQRRYGGDLHGVMEKLSYLKDFGVNVLLLTPVFESPSVQKYDAVTFHHIDNNYGSDRDEDLRKIQSEREDPKTWTMTTSDQVFSDLLKQAHDLDMHVVIEAVFHYCSREFWAFRDLQEKQQNSKYKDWFDVIKWDDPSTPDTVEFAYKSWQNNKDWPLFKQDENGLVEPVKDYVFNCTRRWMDIDGDRDQVDGIDGWYILHANEIAPEFWREWIEFVNALNSQALTVTDPGPDGKEWPGQQPFDLMPDYRFRGLVYQFFVNADAGLKVSEFDKKLEDLRNEIPDEIEDNVIHILDNNQTERIGSAIKNRSLTFADSVDGIDHFYDPSKPEEDDVQIQELLAIFQLTYVGAPLIFYGDESGMWGGPYPDNLKPMLWREFVYEKETYNNIRPDLKDQSVNRFNRDLFDAYRRLNLLRQDNEALKRGNFQTLLVDDERGLYGFARRAGKNQVVVILNDSNTKREVELKSVWKKGAKLKDPLNEKKYEVKEESLKLEVEKKWGVILVND